MPGTFIWRTSSSRQLNLLPRDLSLLFAIPSNSFSLDFSDLRSYYRLLFYCDYPQSSEVLFIPYTFNVIVNVHDDRKIGYRKKVSIVIIRWN